MTMRRTVEICMVGLLLCGTVLAADNGEWKSLCDQNSRMGLDAERVSQMVGHCRKKGLSTRDTEMLLAPVLAASKESLPAECVFIKVEEGLAKQVDAARIVAAAEARLDCLRKARRLIASSPSGLGGGQGPPHLITRTCLVLESGLPEEVLVEIFSRHGGFRYGRLVQVLEAGETLLLAGLGARSTQRIMEDCLDRELNRMEIMRAIDYVLVEHRNGQDFDAIRAKLWLPAD